MPYGSLLLPPVFFGFSNLLLEEEANRFEIATEKLPNLSRASARVNDSTHGGQASTPLSLNGAFRDSMHGCAAAMNRSSVENDEVEAFDVLSFSFVANAFQSSLRYLRLKGHDGLFGRTSARRRSTK